MEQLLQQAGTECTVDVFNVALRQSQACGLMTPTLVRGKEGGAYCESQDQSQAGFVPATGDC